MELADILNRKLDMERKICKIMNEFTIDTRCCIDHVDINRDIVHGPAPFHRVEFRYQVTCYLKLATF